jgi:penicillin-binding protein 2
MKKHPVDVNEKARKLSTKELLSRKIVFIIIMAGAFVVMAVQLFNLQIVNGEQYRVLSENNCLRITPITAPRGDILDTNGNRLVTSRPAFTVCYWYLDKEKALQALPRLAQILDMKLEDIEAKVQKYAGRYFEPIPIAKDISPEQYTMIVEEAPNLPGVFIDPQPIRAYLYGSLAGPVLGYVSEISEAQLADPDLKGYKMGDIIGQQGLESYYESFLRGTAGGYQVEVDYRGRPTGKVWEGIEPEPGLNIQLELDIHLQEVVERAIVEILEKTPEAKAGSCVVLDVKTGGVLAMASVPGFDPNRLVTGISQRELDELLRTGQWRFANLATTGLYPPGSCFKVISAVAALAENVIEPDEEFFDPGYHPMAPTLVCHNRAGHGRVSMREALACSCNVYFYEIGRRLGVDAIAKYAQVLGLGAKTGIDLYGENYGTVPTTEWKAMAYSQGRVAEPAVLLSEHMMAAMGQVFHLDTPIQMASVVQALANDGIRMKPRLARRVLDSEGNVIHEYAPEISAVLDVDPEVIKCVKEGMLGVTEHGGTAYGSFYDLPFKVAGKTGTAENPLGEDHAWFIGFAPYDDPQIALAVIVDQGGGGSAVAAPVARKIFQACIAPEQAG